MKATWSTANKQELLLLEGISVLVDRRKDLLEFLMDPAQPRLRKRAGILREDCWGFSHGEILLVQAALDFWSGSGHLAFWECLETWDDENWIRFIAAIGIVKGLDLRAAVELQASKTALGT